MKSTSRLTCASVGARIPRAKSSVKSSSHHGFARGLMLGGSNLGASRGCATAVSGGAPSSFPRFGGGGGFRATFSASLTDPSAPGEAATRSLAAAISMAIAPPSGTEMGSSSPGNGHVHVRLAQRTERRELVGIAVDFDLGGRCECGAGRRRQRWRAARRRRDRSIGRSRARKRVWRDALVVIVQRWRRRGVEVEQRLRGRLDRGARLRRRIERERWFRPWLDGCLHEWNGKSRLESDAEEAAVTTVVRGRTVAAPTSACRLQA